MLAMIDEESGGGERQLLSAPAFRAKLASSLSQANASITLITAFLTSAGVRWFKEALVGQPRVQIVVRWQAKDLIDGASDLGAYRLAAAHGWSFFVHQKLHAKLWLVDSETLFVGSANVTARGLGLVEGGNLEFGVQIRANGRDVASVSQLVRESVPVTDAICNRLDHWLRARSMEVSSDGVYAWPPDIRSLLEPSLVGRRIWVSECLWTDGQWTVDPQRIGQSASTNVTHDRSLLGLEVSDSQSSHVLTRARATLTESMIFEWLLSRLRLSQGGMHFGDLTAALHDCLADDPKPYRSEVKQLVANLLSWIELVGTPKVVVDRPGYSQRVKLEV